MGITDPGPRRDPYNSTSELVGDDLAVDAGDGLEDAETELGADELAFDHELIAGLHEPTTGTLSVLGRDDPAGRLASCARHERKSPGSSTRRSRVLWQGRVR